jgi:uncharacterized membrane protein
VRASPERQNSGEERDHAGSADPLEHNLESLVAIQREEELRRSAPQRRVEDLSRVIGSPRYLAGLCCFALLWVGYNQLAPALQVAPFDRFPFPLLAAVVALAALISTTVVLIAQNRQTLLEKQRMHLSLQVNLLTEHKVTKLIRLIEELRRDLPMVQDRQDPQAEALQEAADAQQVLAAIEDVGLIQEQQSDRRPPKDR